MKLSEPTDESLRADNLACGAQKQSKDLVRGAQPKKNSRADGNVEHDRSAKADKGEIKGYQNDLTGNATSRVELYLEMAGLKLADLKKFPTPCVDDSQLAPEDFTVTGA